MQVLLIYELGKKIISKALMTKISHISWGLRQRRGYDKGFYGIYAINYILILNGRQKNQKERYFKTKDNK